MPDREKVIKGLEQCIKVPYVCDADCPYYNTSLCREQLQQDALALLKEQDRSKHGHWVVLKDCSNAGVY